MRRILIFSSLALFTIMVGCKAKKATIQSTEDMVEIKEPFDSKEFKTDDKNFRAVGVANSQDLSFCKTKSSTDAKAKLAATIETKIKMVNDKFASEYTAGKSQEYRDSFKGITREIVNQSLNEIHELGVKSFKAKDGTFTVYTAIEVNKDNIYKSIKNKISNDQKLRTDFEEERYKKTFDEEMNKFDNGN